MDTSRLRLQQWLDERRAEFEQRLLEAAPSLAASRRGLIQWLPPEDLGEALWPLVLGAPTPREDGFWPDAGPDWDAAGTVPDLQGGSGLVLVAARSNVDELAEDEDRVRASLAFLSYLNEQRRHPTWLVNVYFTGDRQLSGPDPPEVWRQAIEEQHRSLGAPSDRAIDLFLPDGAP
jgi:hypothetical protein